jgi:hypothetical protein
MTPFEAGLEATGSRAIQAVSSFPKVEVAPSDAALPANLAQSDLAATMLEPLVNQFGLMQQQMFDQFQQAMAMMVQMFGKMHHDQMEVIRTELDQLRELTEEFHALKNELARRSRVETASHDLTTGPGDPKHTTPVEPGVSATRLVAAASQPSNGLEVASVDPSPMISVSSVTAGFSEQQMSPEARLSLTQPSSGAPGAPASHKQRQEPGLFSPMTSNDEGLAGNSERDSLVWLHQRIASLQRERESRWQKILKLLPGMS